MNLEDIKNTHLEKIIQKINEYPPDKTITKRTISLLYNELLVADLISAYWEDMEDNLFKNESIYYIPLFTSMKEFNKYFDGKNVRAEKNKIDEFIYGFLESFENVYDEDIMGVIINPKSDDEICLQRHHLDTIRYHYYTDFMYHYNRKSVHNHKQLMKLKNKTRNNQLIQYLNKGKPKANELIEQLCLAKIFVLYKSENALKEKRDIVNIKKLPDLYYDNKGYCYIFSDYKNLKETYATLKTDDYLYAQVLNLNWIINFVLPNELEGIILNKNSNNIKISRNNILLNYKNIIHTTFRDNPSDVYMNYGFVIK